MPHVSSHACCRNGDSRFAGRGGADRAGPGRMAGGRTIQCGDRRRRALAVAIQRSAHSPCGGARPTILYRDRSAAGDARFRSHAAEEQLRALLATYETSLNAGDAGRIEKLYAEDGVFMPAGFPTASGRSAVRGAYDAVFSNIRIAIHFTVDELTVKGDVAYARTHSAGTATVVATGASGPEENRELFIFARGANGWKIARYMFNKAS